MFKTQLKALALATALLGSSASMAATLTNSAGSFNNWGGFDWAQNGTAVIDGFNAFVANDTFDLTYWANAVSVTKLGGGSIVGATIPLLLNTYEYTVQVNMNESSTCNAFAFPGGPCADASFQVNSGSFNIWYDTNVDADMVTGAGITDGILLISGTISGQPSGGFNILTGGTATLDAMITYTNSSYISPSLLTSNATTTLQVGSTQTNWTVPTSMPGAAGGTAALPVGSFALQADGNQAFTATTVPEPGTLALMGAALAGLGLSRRRKSA